MFTIWNDRKNFMKSILFLFLLSLIKTSVALLPSNYRYHCHNHNDGSTTRIAESSNFFDSFQNVLKSFTKEEKKVVTPTVDEALSTKKEIESARGILIKASNREIDTKDSDMIVDSLMSLEKSMRKQNKLDGGLTAENTLKNLNGAWRLIFTTGTVDTQKKIGGRINYFPLKAVQSFDTEQMKISNGIFINDFTLVKFYGPFEFNMKARKVIFDFDEIEVLGFRFKLPKGGAAKIGKTTGLGSEKNVDLELQGKKPFFNWISADEEIATARGGGGGLALWKRYLAV